MCDLNDVAGGFQVFFERQVGAVEHDRVESEAKGFEYFIVGAVIKVDDRVRSCAVEFTAGHAIRRLEAHVRNNRSSNLQEYR